MAKAKRDLSRLVMLNMTPSESLVVVAALELMRQRTVEQFELHVLEGAMLHIKLQLTALAWPIDQKKAPYPI